MHDQPLARERNELLEAIRDEARQTARWTGRDHFSPAVMRAIARVPREEFVPEDLRRHAYANEPLPIGSGQTISQPYIVALMTDLIDPSADDVVLDVGTGSGYQAAVVSLLVRQVYGVEVLDTLADAASERLRRLGYANIAVRAGDGNAGWAEHAPYDAIIVAATAPSVPPALIEQLRPGGRMVIPIGRQHFEQHLVRIVKDEAGHVHERSVLPVAFVPLVSPLVSR